MGFASARCLAEDGARVAIVGRTKDVLERAAKDLTGWGSVGVEGSDPYALMAAIDKHFGHPAHLPRAGQPEEIGPVVAFLASKHNSYMTGANINVDGGSDFT